MNATVADSWRERQVRVGGRDRWLPASVLIAALLSSGSSLGTEQPKAQRAREAVIAPEPQLPMKELMAHVVAYSAQNVWNKQGWITDKSGQRSLFPKNDQEWEDAEGAALTLGELMPLLLQPGWRVNVPGWDRSAALVRKLARQAAVAAEKHDEAAFFRIGTQIDEACESCHRAVGIVE